MSKTRVSIKDGKFYLNDEPLYKGKTWDGHNMEGLLMNARMAQGIFDDLNPTTVSLFRYPDTGVWDPERNNADFLAAMDEWKQKGLAAFTLNMQGGQPGGFHNWYQKFRNRGYRENGSLDPDYMRRLKRVLDKADDLGLIVIFGYFYWGQDQTLENEEYVLRAARELTAWLLEHDYTNVLVEVCNECDIATTSHETLWYKYVHKMVRFVKEQCGDKLLVSASFLDHVPTDEFMAEADFVLIHGNSVDVPSKMKKFIADIRASRNYTNQPIVINEDDHYDFESEENNMKEAVRNGVAWGYFDWPGYQKLPTTWKIDTPRKEAFFKLLGEMVL